jgi:hypothetical protein
VSVNCVELVLAEICGAPLNVVVSCADPVNSSTIPCVGRKMLTSVGDRVCVAEDREDGQSAVVVGMNFGVW